MQNELLLGDKKDVEIAKLKLQIKKFKDYDSKRKDYYKDKMSQLDELKSFFKELESNGKESLIKTMREKILYLNRIIQLRAIECSLTEQELTDSLSRVSIVKENKALRREIKDLTDRLSNAEEIIAQLGYKRFKVK